MNTEKLLVVKSRYTHSRRFCILFIRKKDLAKMKTQSLAVLLQGDTNYSLLRICIQLQWLCSQSQPNKESVLVCCTYCATHRNAFRWTNAPLVNLVCFLKKKQAKLNVENKLVTGVINFVSTDWHTLTSCCEKEQYFFDALASLNL